jgi:hypothetical protein
LAKKRARYYGAILSSGGIKRPVPERPIGHSEMTKPVSLDEVEEMLMNV